MNYQFKVKLSHAKRIWRIIEIKGNQTFADFHEAIFDAFDRDDEHLYSFYITKGRKGRRRYPMSPEITHPMNMEGYYGDSDKQDAEKTCIKDIGLREGEIIEYLFDFGDNWEHEIILEKIVAEKEGARYPRILKKSGESPPQYPDYDEYDE